MSDTDLQVTFGADTSALTKGAGEAQSAIADFAPKIQQLSQSFAALASELKDSFSGLQSLASGLASAGQAGAAGLAGVAGAAGGVVMAVAAVTEIALGAAGAMAQWAAATATSSSASADARQNAAGLNTALGQAHDALTDVGNALANALAPTLTVVVQGIAQLAQGFLASYSSGGAAKTIVDAITATVKLLALAAGATALEVTAAIDVVRGGYAALGPVFQMAIDEVVGWGKQTGDAAITAGKLIYDALTNNILGGASDAAAGWKKIQQDADETAKVVAADAAKMRAAFMRNGGEEMVGAVGAYGDLASRLITPGANGAGAPQAPQGAGAAGNGAGQGPQTGGSSGAGQQQAQAQQWADQLHQTEVQAAAASGDYMKDQLSSEVAFWQQKLALTQQNSKAWFDVQDKLFPLLKQQQSEAFSALVAGDKKAIESDRGNAAQWAADWTKYLADVAHAYGADSAAYRNALTEKQNAESEADKQLVAQSEKAIEQQTAAMRKGYADQATTAKASSEEQIAAVKLQFDMGKISADQYFGDVQAIHQKEDAAQIASVQAQLQAVTDGYNKQIAVKGLTFDAAIALDDKYVAEWGQLQTKLGALTTDALRQWLSDQAATLMKFKQSWSSVVDPIVSGFNSGVVEMIEGTKSFQQVMRSVGQQILTDFVTNVIDKQVESWLWGVTEQVLATAQGQALLDMLGMQQTALSIANDMKRVASNATANTVMTASNTAAQSAGLGTMLAQTFAWLKADAAKVYGGVFAALSQNPVTAIAAAPVAAAAAASVMSFSYAEQGWWQVPSDNMPTLLHKDEQVLPARIANPARNFFEGLASGGASMGAGHSFNFGDFNVHGAPSGMSSSEFRQALSDHASHVAGAVAGALRNGYMPPYKQPTGRL